MSPGPAASAAITETARRLYAERIVQRAIGDGTRADLSGLDTGTLLALADVLLLVEMETHHECDQCGATGASEYTEHVGFHDGRDVYQDGEREVTLCRLCAWDAGHIKPPEPVAEWLTTREVPE